MANLPEVSNFDSVYQWETNDPVLAGADGIMNTPLKNLTNRTKWLKDQLEIANTKLADFQLRRVVGYAEDGGTNQLLYADAQGTLFIMSPNATGPTTLILPTSASCPDGTMMAFKSHGSDSTNKAVINRNGSDTINHEGKSLTSFTLENGDYVVVVSVGSVWYVVSYTSSGIGKVEAFAASTIPFGYLECNGAEISRSTYATLFTKIGTIFGVGNGTTTFNIPDLRGEFIRGWDHARGIDSGRTIGSSQGDLVKAHTHDIVAAVAAVSTIDMITATADGTTSGALTIATSANIGAENRPRNVALMYCIKY